MPEKQTAIIRGAKYGVGDRGVPWLAFETYVTESSAASHYITQPRADEIIKAAGVADVRDLNGKPCWVNVTSSTIEFVEMWRA